MSEILRSHALSTLWCEPRQDRQHLIKPARLTKPGGVRKEVKVLWEVVQLPANNKSFHVYQIGQLHPGLFAIEIKPETWYRLDTLMTSDNLVVDVFFDNGTRLANMLTWLRVNRDKNLILAIEYRPSFDTGGYSLDNKAIFTRFYANARFEDASFRSTLSNPFSGVRVVERLITSESEYSHWRDDVALLESEFGNRGLGIYQIDGFIVPKPIVYKTSYLNRILRCVWDESIFNIETFNFTDLEQTLFTSELDLSVVKYAVVKQPPYGVLDYHDDIDFYITTGDASFKGVYLGRIRGDEVRQLTHTAYSLRKDVVDAIRAKHSMFSGADVKLMVVTRENGRTLGFTPTHNRVEALYMLTHSQIIEAMTSSANTTVPEWKAAKLENSAYTRVMRSFREDISLPMVEEAYGYNAATLVACPPLNLPLLVNPGISQRYVQSVPPLLMTRDIADTNGLRTLYGYSNGRLVDWVNDFGLYDPIPLPVNWEDLTEVECFNYKTSETVDGVYYDTHYESADLKQYGFRCYACPIIGGIPSEQWSDITDITAYYTYDSVGTEANGYTPTLTWNEYLLDFANLYPCVKINKIMHWHKENDISPSSYDGVLKTTVTTEVTWNNVTTDRPQRLSPGNVDVFVNGFPLIQGIDYYLKWPDIVIVRRIVYLDESGDEPVWKHIPVNQLEIQVRSYGFCNPDNMQDYKPREVGFAKGGILSVDGRYDIRNDRNIRVIVANQLMQRSQVRFAEEGSGPLVPDGRPYSVSDYVLPVENFTTQTTPSYKNKAYDLDERVIDYVSTRLHGITPHFPYILNERWEVFSPFCSRIIHAMLNGEIGNGDIAGVPNDAEADTLTAPYHWLLEFDPCVRNTDLAYIVVYAHQYTDVVELTPDQYRFLEFIIAKYLHSRVDPTPSVTIVP